MPSLFSIADAGVKTLAQHIIDQHHAAIMEANVEIEYVFAAAEKDKNGDPKGPALKLHGYPKTGICKIISAQERALGRADARISIDKDWWDKAGLPYRKALLDHELYHLIVVRSADGDIQTDEYQRPKLRMRFHDHEFGWFDAIAARHGMASAEVISATRFFEEHGSVYVQREMSFSS